MDIGVSRGHLTPGYANRAMYAEPASRIIYGMLIQGYGTLLTPRKGAEPTTEANNASTSECECITWTFEAVAKDMDFT